MSKMIGNRRAGKQVFYGLNPGFDAGGSSLTVSVQNYDVRIDHKG
jgi:hypothetical protein